MHQYFPGVQAYTKISNLYNIQFKIIKSFKDLGILLKGVNKTIENEAREQKDGLLGMLQCTLGASSLWNLPMGKNIIRRGNTGK